MIEELYIKDTTWIGPGLTEVTLISERHGDLFCGQGKTADIAIDKAFQVARQARRFRYPSIVYCSDEYWLHKWGFS
ncbi:MAG: hypothetical protein PVH19_00020 [Planctomycetia bacterium]|jgi:hypothetical protein